MLLNYQLKQSAKHELTNKNENIFIVHGLFGSLSNLSGLAKELQMHFNIILVDVRNHGKSPRNKSMSYPDMANDIFKLADALNIDSFSIIGHSMGGKIAMTCALLQPQRIKRLIIADIAPVSYPDKHNNVFLGLKFVQQSQVKSRHEADQLLSRYIETPEVRLFLLKSLQREGDQFKFLYDLDNLHNNYSLISAWPEFKNSFDNPTLFIKGANSDYIDLHNPQPIMAHFPNAKAKVINDTGHWLHAEKPKIFNRLIVNFLTS